MFIRGSVDVVTGTAIEGWVYAPNQSEPTLVQVLLNHEILGEALADIFRPDLVAAGLGDGRCGYAVKPYREIGSSYLPFLSVKIAGGDAELPRAGTAGFHDFFTALYREHPATGRTRSLLGGLWIDRIDAAAVLKGRRDVGLITQESIAPIAELIHAGVIIVDLKTEPEKSWRRVEQDAINTILSGGILLPILRNVLEDNPLVVSATLMRGKRTDFLQPSTEISLPSPTECLAVIVPLSEGVVLSVVRDSHMLPEFTAGGVSRWVKNATSIGMEMVATHGVLDRHALPPGSAALIGPGTIYRLSCESGADAVRLLCLPARLMPVALALDVAKHETANSNGVRVLA
jgi:hypothetical protein